MHSEGAVNTSLAASVRNCSMVTSIGHFVKQSSHSAQIPCEYLMLKPEIRLKKAKIAPIGQMALQKLLESKDCAVRGAL